MTNLNQQMEVLADIEHQRWSHWQKYMHSKMVEHSDGKGEWMCLPVELFHQWERQIATEYADLSEAEKQSDRDQVERYLPAINTLMSEIINSTPLPHEPSITTTDIKSGVGGNYVVSKDWHDPATLTHEEIHTLINKLIERQQEEATRTLIECITQEDKPVFTPEIMNQIITQTATEAYRQALEDVLAGLPPNIEVSEFHPGSEQSESINTALQTVRAQIEGLLNKIK